MPRAKTNRSKTLINYIVDESGSMMGIQKQVRDGFWEYITELQKNGEGEILVTLTKFNTTTVTPYVAKPLAEVGELDYQAGGSTALYDAIANTIKKVEPTVDKNTKVVTLVMTDGQENSSIENSAAQVNALVSAKQAEGNWTFIFLGADRDAWADAAHLGFARGNVMSYNKGLHTNSMRSVSQVTSGITASAASSTLTAFADAGQSESDYNTTTNPWKDTEGDVDTPKGK